MTTSSFYWYDLETSGIDPRRDRIMQFAGVRTDLDFLPLGDPDIWYARLSVDVLPDPDACLITGITPQVAQKKGRHEAAVVADIHSRFMVPGTCVLGYNTLRFDDEVLRHTFFRNLYDPYEREWRSGNSRWDLIDVMRMTHALRPESLAWPRDKDGLVTFRLDALARENGVLHAQAHDAMSDVTATIGLARMLKQHAPRLFQFAFDHRDKRSALALLQPATGKVLLHVATAYTLKRSYIAPVMTLMQHPQRTSEYLVADLGVDPDSWLVQLETAQVPGADWPLRWVRINRCPMLAPMSVLRDQDAERLGIDRQRCDHWAEKLTSRPDVLFKLEQLFQHDYSNDPSVDPELSLYSGPFLADADKRLLSDLRTLGPEQRAIAVPAFADERLYELWFRYRARNYPESLSEQECQKWVEFCRYKHFDDAAGLGLGYSQFMDKIALKMQEITPGSKDEQVIDELLVYAREIFG